MAVIFDFDTNGMQDRAVDYKNIENCEGIDNLFAVETTVNNSIKEIDEYFANSGLTEIVSLGFVSRETELEELRTNMHILGNYPEKLTEELYVGYDGDLNENVSECLEALESIKLTDFTYSGSGVMPTLKPSDKLDDLYYSVKDYYGTDIDNVSLETVIGLYRVTTDDLYKSILERQLRGRLRDAHENNVPGDSELEALFPYFDMEETIVKFESENPEAAEKFDEWFATDKDNNLTYADRVYIKYYVYTTSEDYREIFFNNMSSVTIVTTVPTEDWEKGPAHYTSGSGLYLRYQDNFLFCATGPYISLFHEFGHGADDMGVDGTIAYTLSNGNTGTLTVFGTMTYNQDVMLPSDAVLPPVGAEIVSTGAYENVVNMTTEGAIMYDVYYNKNNPHSALAIANDLVVNNGYSGSATAVTDALYNRVDSSTLSVADRALYNEVVKEMQNGPTGYPYATVTDIYGGASDNMLRGNSGIIWGHSVKYWNEDNPLNYKLELELWAEWYSYNMTGDITKIENTIEYLPTASQIMQGYASELARE